MKQNLQFKILFSAIFVFFAFSINSNAQLGNALTPFTAKAGLTAATKEAKTKSKVSNPNPVLRSIATMAISANGLDVSFNMSNGKSAVWVYIFEDKNIPDSITSVALVSVPLFGYQNIETIAPQLNVGEMLASFADVLPSKAMSVTNWLESGEMASKVKQDANYQKLFKKYPNAIPNLIGLGKNEINPLLTMDLEYWSLVFSEDNSPKYTCYTEAVGGKVTCQEFNFSSIENDNTILNFQIYPNPSSDVLYINNTFENENYDVEIYDNLGKMINAYRNLTSNTSIDLRNFQTGVYQIKIIQADQISSKAIVISK